MSAPSQAKRVRLAFPFAKGGQSAAFDAARSVAENKQGAGWRLVSLRAVKYLSPPGAKAVVAYFDVPADDPTPACGD